MTSLQNGLFITRLKLLLNEIQDNRHNIQ